MYDLKFQRNLVFIRSNTTQPLQWSVFFMHVLVLKFFDTRLSDEILEMHQLYSVLNMVYGESPLYIYICLVLKLIYIPPVGKFGSQ